MKSSWDTWHAQALAEGVDAELAQLGREILRDHVQHGHDMATESGTWYLAEHPQYMIEPAKLAPQTAFLQFNASIIWASGSRDVDGDVEAYSLLIERVGSEAKAEEVLGKERSTLEHLMAKMRAGDRPMPGAANSEAFEPQRRT